MTQPEGNFLEYTMRQQLLKMHKKERDGRIKDRIKVILLLDQGWSYDKIAQALFLDHTSIRKLYDKYGEHGIDALTTFYYKGRSSYLSESDLESLKVHLQSKIYQTSNEIIEYVLSTLSVKYKKQGIIDLLHRLGFSYKKPKLVPGKSDKEAQEKFLEELQYIKETKDPDTPILYMDGVHPQHNSKPAHGY